MPILNIIIFSAIVIAAIIGLIGMWRMEPENFGPYLTWVCINLTIAALLYLPGGVFT